MLPIFRINFNILRQSFIFNIILGKTAIFNKKLFYIALNTESIQTVIAGRRCLYM